jgi:hypothetical protein
MADQRLAVPRSDAPIAEVESNRMFCTLWEK